MKPVLLFGAAALLAAVVVAWRFAKVPSRAVAGTASVTIDPRDRERDSAAASLSVPAASAQRPFVSASARGDPAASPETARLEERRRLYEAVDALLQASEFERVRQLLDEDQERADELAPDRDRAQAYRLIADCLERPNPLHRARGQAFLLVNEATALNPKLRAACAPE
jgi:hypothetical protein